MARRLESLARKLCRMIATRASRRRSGRDRLSCCSRRPQPIATLPCRHWPGCRRRKICSIVAGIFVLAEVWLAYRPGLGRVGGRPVGVTVLEGPLPRARCEAVGREIRVPKAGSAVDARGPAKRSGSTATCAGDSSSGGCWLALEAVEEPVEHPSTLWAAEVPVFPNAPIEGHDVGPAVLELDVDPEDRREAVTIVLATGVVVGGGSVCLVGSPCFCLTLAPVPMWIGSRAAEHEEEAGPDSRSMDGCVRVGIVGHEVVHGVVGDSAARSCEVPITELAHVPSHRAVGGSIGEWFSVRASACGGLGNTRISTVVETPGVVQRLRRLRTGGEGICIGDEWSGIGARAERHACRQSYRGCCIASTGRMDADRKSRCRRAVLAARAWWDEHVEVQCLATLDSGQPGPSAGQSGFQALMATGGSTGPCRLPRREAGWRPVPQAGRRSARGSPMRMHAATCWSSRVAGRRFPHLSPIRGSSGRRRGVSTPGLQERPVARGRRW